MAEKGSLELILGTMFSRKTTALINRLNEIKHSTPHKIQLFKPVIDNRYADDKIVTHDKLEMPCFNIENTEELIEQLESKTKVIGIDEIEFFDDEIIYRCKELINRNKIIVACGLLYDFRNEFFTFRDSEKTMIDLLALVPDRIRYRHAFCKYEIEDEKFCGKLSFMTQRFMPDGNVAPYDDPLIMLGKEDINPEEQKKLKRTYSPRCREHFQHYKEVLKK